MRKIRILIAVGLLTLFIPVYLSLSADFKYVGSAKSNKYHYPTCQWARKIKPANLVTFKTTGEALGAGYIPCKVCKPPTKD